MSRRPTVESQAEDVDLEEVEADVCSTSSSEDEDESPWYTTGVPVEVVLQELDKKNLATQLVSDFFKYIPFLVMFVFFFLGLAGTKTYREIPHQYYVGKVLRDILWDLTPIVHEVEKPAPDLEKSEDWVVWSEHLVHNVWECKEPTKSLPQLAFQGQNYLLGAIRFRTQRMKPDTCTVNEERFDVGENHPCWGEFDSAHTERTMRYGFPHPALFPEWSDLVITTLPNPTGVSVSELFFGVEQLGAPVEVVLRNFVVRNPHGVNPPHHGAHAALDSDEKTDWVDDDAGSIVITFDRPTRLGYFSYLTSNTDPINDPVQWLIIGSPDNGMTWEILQRQDWTKEVTTARRARLPWMRLTANKTATFTHIRFQPLAMRGVAEDFPTYWVNWEPSPFDPSVANETLLQKGMVLGEADAYQIAELRFRPPVGPVVIHNVPFTYSAPPVDDGMGNGGVIGTAYFTPPPTQQFPDSAVESAVDGLRDTQVTASLNSSIGVAFADMIKMDEYTFITSSDRPWRDPMQWSVYGTNSPNLESSWVLLHQVAYQTPLTRKRQLPWFKLGEGSAPRVFSHYKFTVEQVRGGVRPDQLLYQYQNCENSFKTLYYGDISTYDCSGYVVDVPFDSTCNTALASVHALQSENYPFIDNVATRLVMTEMFTYSPQTNDVFTVKFSAEAAAGGDWVIKNKIRVFPMWSSLYVGQTVYDMFFYAFVLYFIYRFVEDWKRFARRNTWYMFCAEVWNILEFLNLCCFIIVFVFRTLWWRTSANEKFHLRYPSRFPIELEVVDYYFIVQLYANEVNTIITFLKFLKFVRINNKLNLLTRTISESKEQLAGILFIFVYIVLAFALSAMQLFGPQLFEYRTLGVAYSTLSRILLGDFDYESLRQENKWLAGIWFWAFVILGLFIMLNFLVAILMTNFATVSQSGGNDVPFDEQMQKMWYKLKRMLHPARIKKDVVNLLHGTTKSALFDSALANMDQYWKMLRICSTCGCLSRCICNYTIDKGTCSKCKSTSRCSMSGGTHAAYCRETHLVYRYDMRSMIGEEVYDMLGAKTINDFWQDVLWEYARQRENDEAAQAEDTVWDRLG